MKDLTTSEERLNYLSEVLRMLSADENPVRSLNRFAVADRRLNGDQGYISVSRRGVPEGSYRVMRFVHQFGVAETGLTDLFYAGPNAPIYRGGFIGEHIARGEPRVFQNVRIEDDPVLGNQIAPYRSIACLPSFDHGEALNWSLWLHTDADVWSATEVEHRFVMANLMGGLTNYKRTAIELRDATAWIDREIDEIAAIQRGILPQALPEIEGYRMAAHYDTFERAGGDYYDVFRLETGDGGPERWVLMMADASGHGPSAAVVVAMMSALLRACPRHMARPGDILLHLNKHLSMRSVHGSFVTAFLGVLEPESGALTYCCAGHPPPFVRRSGGEAHALETIQGMPLGLFDGSAYGEETTELRAGEALLMFTDGVTEAMNGAGDQFSPERLQEIFTSPTRDPEQCLAAIADHLTTHRNGAPPNDDQAMLLLVRE